MVNVIKHPLIDIKLTKMRVPEADHTLFRDNLNEIASLMVYEILRDYKAKDSKITTATGTDMVGKDFDSEIIIAPILRAGLGMVQGILELVPQARVGHIGLYRDEETFEAIEYFYKMPEVSKDSTVLVVDPMLATGVSAIDAIAKLKKDGFTNISFVALVAAPEGVKALEEKFPDVDIHLAALDEKLNEKKYIIPGLGDAGDRIFGTK